MIARRNRHSERGQALPLLAVSLTAVVGILAFVGDVGYWRYQQRLEQAAADSAAITGTIQLYYPHTPGGSAPKQVTAAAQRAAADNGFADGGGTGDVTITVNSPPSSNAPPLPGATPYPAGSAAEVVVSKKQPAFFAHIFGQDSQVVSARAVAVQKTDFSACLYQLKPASAGGQVLVNGGQQVVAKNCGVIANGAVNASMSATGLGWYGTPPNTNLNPSLIHQLPTPATDPCYRIRGCAYLQNTPIPPISEAVDASGMTTISAPPQPGYLVLKNCCSGNPQLGPGLYYVYGGISGTFYGKGVTIVNVDGPNRINGQGRGSPDILAPQTFGPPDNSPTAGVAFYQPPSNPNPVVFNGTPAWFDGLYYAPTSYSTGNGQPDEYSFLVIGSLVVNGKGVLVDPNLSPASADFNPAQFPTTVVLSE